MKITFTRNEDLNATLCQRTGSSYFNLFIKDALKIEIDDICYFIEGELYYSKACRSHDSVKINSENIRDVITHLVTQHGAAKAHHYLEGVYVGCWINLREETAGVFADALNQSSLYYREHQGEMTLSTDLKELVTPETGFNQFALYSYLLVGYAPEKETFYKDVLKFGSDSTLNFNAEGFEWQFCSKIHHTQNLNAQDMTRYEDLLVNAVTSRSGERNVVMSSGGWDSTSLLSLLNENKTRQPVDAVVFDVILPDGQSFNKYEVDKAQRIGQYFEVNTECAVVDYRNQSIIDYWQENTQNLRENHTYFWLHHLKIADLIGSRFNNKTRIFNGEGADSIHNFGFSQFVSVNYENMQLREYADKAKSYLYGPSFFASVNDGTYSDDKILKFFQHYHGEKAFENLAHASELKRRQHYFESFMLSGTRVPFAKWQMSHLATEQLQKEYSEHLYHHYFQDVVTKSDTDSVYYWLLQLYRRFHFHSYQIGVTQVALKPYGQHCSMPFLDSQLLEFMYEMPEQWGRGLELRTTKYPLRFLAENKWNMPLNILMEKGPHSYIAEGDKRWSYAGGSWNIYCEIMFKSPFSHYFRSVLQTAPLEQVFDSGYFNLEAVSAAINRYIDGEECIPDVSLLFRMAVLFSIGFINIQ